MAAKPDKKEAILEAMLDLIVERGFHDAPMSVLAKRSGASAGVIYHYFPSKDDLIHALYLRVKSIKVQSLLEGYVPGMSPHDAFIHLWANAYRFYREHLRETRFLDQYENSPFCGGAPQTVEEDNIRIDALAAVPQDGTPRPGGEPGFDQRPASKKKKRSRDNPAPEHAARQGAIANASARPGFGNKKKKNRRG